MSNIENKQCGCTHHHEWSAADQNAMETTGSPEIQPMSHECAFCREADIARLKATYDVHPEPALGHPVHHDCQPNPEQKDVQKEGDVLHGYHGG